MQLNILSIFQILKPNVSLIDHDRELTRVRVIQAVDRFIPYSIVPYFTDFIYLREVPSLTIINRAMLSSNQNSALISLNTLTVPYIVMRSFLELLHETSLKWTHLPHPLP